MVFFQGVLLLGYGYAHLLTTRCSLRTGMIIHAGVFLTAFLFLPIAIPDSWLTPPDTMQQFWLIGLFAVSVGLPFFAVSANAPLLQAWFARTGHRQANDPYFLYGASNIGSFGALFSYIILFEPILTLKDQSDLWMAGFAVLVLAIAISAYLTLKLTGRARISVATTERKTSRTPTRKVLAWIGLAALPSGLLVSVTAHISTDVASTPFLWVLPLALFLATFIVAFRTRSVISAKTLSSWIPWVGVGFAIAIFINGHLPLPVAVCLNLGCFFLAALYCHTVLFEARPEAGELTRFYLWMSFGGVVGGIFASLIAPQIFNWVAEYPLFALVVLFIRPAIWKADRTELKISLLAASAIALVWLLAARIEILPKAFDVLASPLTIVILVFFAGLIQIRLPALSLLPLVLAIPATILSEAGNSDIFAERTFFGVITVRDTPDARHRLMIHGTTMHGAMRLDDQSKRPEPLTYYHETGGMAAALRATQNRLGGTLKTGGIVGLGTGSLLCHTKSGETWTVFEIDAGVVRTASDPALFSFVPECGSNARIVVGDARLTLKDEPNGQFDYLLIDAFSSDSIPVHLITSEAIGLYFDKISDDGLLVLHISNRHMELKSVLAAIAQEGGWQIRAGRFNAPKAEDGPNFILDSIVVAMAREDAHFGEILGDERWQTPDPGAIRPWTDDYSDILGAILRKMRAPSTEN